MNRQSKQLFQLLHCSDQNRLFTNCFEYLANGTKPLWFIVTQTQTKIFTSQTIKVILRLSEYHLQNETQCDLKDEWKKREEEEIERDGEWEREWLRGRVIKIMCAAPRQLSSSKTTCMNCAIRSAFGIRHSHTDTHITLHAPMLTYNMHISHRHGKWVYNVLCKHCRPNLCSYHMKRMPNSSIFIMK